MWLWAHFPTKWASLCLDHSYANYITRHCWVTKREEFVLCQQCLLQDSLAISHFVHSRIFIPQYLDLCVLIWPNPSTSSPILSKKILQTTQLESGTPINGHLILAVFSHLSSVSSLSSAFWKIIFPKHYVLLSQYLGRSRYRGPSKFIISSSTRVCVKVGYNSPLAIKQCHNNQYNEHQNQSQN